MSEPYIVSEAHHSCHFDCEATCAACAELHGCSPCETTMFMDNYPCLNSVDELPRDALVDINEGRTDELVLVTVAEWYEYKQLGAA